VVLEVGVRVEAEVLSTSISSHWPTREGLASPGKHARMCPRSLALSVYQGPRCGRGIQCLFQLNFKWMGLLRTDPAP